VLCETAARLAGVDGAAVAVLISPQVRELLYATDEVAQKIDELQYATGEGPCLDAHYSQWPQLYSHLEGDARQDPWLAFSSGVRELGVEAVFAFPVPGAHSESMGVLELYRRAPGPLSDDQVNSAATCGEAIGEIIRMHIPSTAGELDAATDAEPASLDYKNPFSRSAVYQASGMVALQLGISTGEALARIRAHAYAQGVPITHAAADIVAQRFSIHEW
jgi:hypothetical protein